MKVAVVPETVQTLAVVDARFTVSPELAVAVSVRGVPTVCVPGLAKLMVCAVSAALKVNVSALLAPPGVITVTLIAPGLSAGEVAVILVDEFTMKLVAAVLPNMTEVAPVRLVPVSVTEAPPASGPLLGLIPVNVGAVS